MTRRVIEQLRGTIITEEEIDVILPILRTSFEHIRQCTIEIRVDFEEPTIINIMVAGNKFGKVKYVIPRAKKIDIINAIIELIDQYKLQKVTFVADSSNEDFTTKIFENCIDLSIGNCKFCMKVYNSNRKGEKL